jgi:hypothetical protein
MIDKPGTEFSLRDWTGLDEDAITKNENDANVSSLGSLAGWWRRPPFLFTHTEFYRLDSEFR